MTILKKNILANFVGSTWQSLIGFLFVPVYIKFIGMEGWGLVGFYSTLQAVFALLDMGLNSTLSRETARLTTHPDKASEVRNLVKTLEAVYWGISVCVGGIVLCFAQYIASHWIKSVGIPTGIVHNSVVLMGVVIAIQMPISFYSGGLIGLQKQVLLSYVNITISTIRVLGAIVVLWVVSPTVTAFFVWQIIVSSLHLVVVYAYLWTNLPASEKQASFDLKILRSVWRFTAGMGGISVLAVVLAQADKIVLSRILDLSDFGYYVLASMVAMGLGRIFTPIFTAVYPRFVQLVSLGDQDGLTVLYHKTCQFLAVLVLPIALLIASFSYEIVLIWTQDIIAAQKTYLLISILVSGSAIAGLMNLPYALQLAFGWTSLSLTKTSIGVVLIVPMCIYAATHFGAIGAAFSWLVLNLGMFLFEIPVMHHYILTAEKFKWYFEDVGKPLFACFPGLILGRLLINPNMSQWIILFLLFLTLVVMFATCALLTPATRVWIVSQIKQSRGRVSGNMAPK